MAVQYFIPGLGLAKFDDGTTPEQAFKIAGVDLPEPESKGAQLIPSLKRGTGQLIRGAGSALKDIAPETGEAVEQYGKGVEEANPPAYPNLSSVHSIGGALGYLGERTAEGAPLLVGSALASLAGPEAGAATMFGGMAVPAYGETRDVQRETGNDNIPGALGAAAVAGTLGAFGGAGGKVVSTFGGDLLRATAKEAGEGVFKSAAKGAVKGAAEQAAINPIIGATERAAEGKDLTSPEAQSEYLEQAVSGAAVGGVVGGALHPFTGGKKPIAETENANLLKSESPDAAVNHDLDKDLFGRTPADNLPIGPQAPEKAPEYTPDDLAGLKAERSRLLRAAADADTREDYYKYLDAAGKIDQQLNKPGMQFLDRQVSGRQASADTGQQPSLFGAASPVERPAPPAPLALPGPDKFRPPLYADSQGNVGPNPDIRATRFAVAPEGSQGNLFTPEPDHPQSPAPVQAGGQPPTPLTGAGQPSLFGVTPTASVKSDFGPREVLQRIQRASFYEKDIKGKSQDQRSLYLRPIDAKFTTDLADGVAQNLAAGNSAGAQQHIDLQLQTLQDHRGIGSKGIEVRKQALQAAQEIVHDYNARMVDAYAQEAKQRAPEPGAQVSTGPTGMSPDEMVAQQRQAALDAQQQKAQADAATQQQASAADQQAQANQTVVDSHRNAIVQKVLNDHTETNHRARIEETLKRNGLDPELRPHEREAVDNAQRLQQRRAEATDAFSKPDVVPDTNPNQPIFEYSPQDRGPGEGGGNAPRESNTTRGYHAPENFKMEAQSEDAFQRLEDARKRREARETKPELAPTRNTRQGEMFTPTGKVKKAVDNRINRDPNAPENFKLERPRPEDIHEPAPDAAPQDGLSFTPSNRQGEMLTPTGKIKKAVDQRAKNSPENFKLEAQTPDDFPAPREPAAEPAPAPDKRQGEMFTPTGKIKKSADQGPFKTIKPETKGEQIKREVAEKNAATRERKPVEPPKEEPNAVAARQEPESNRGEHQDRGERGTSAEASDRNSLEQGRQEPEAEGGEVTYDSVLKDAAHYASEDSGLLKPYELQKLRQMAQGKAVDPGKLKELLDAAVQRNSERSMAEAYGVKRRLDDGSETKHQPYTREDGQYAYDTLRDRLDELGMHDAGLHISSELIKTAEGPAKGAYAPIRKVIAVAMGSAKDMYTTLNHEVIHHIVNIGVITKPEYNTLVRALRRNKDLSDAIDRAYKRMSRADRDEELVAEGYARWVNGDQSILKYENQPRGLFDKIKQFFAAIKDVFNKQGHDTAEDVFSSIDGGEMGMRERPGNQVSPEFTKARAAAITKDAPDVSREVVRNVLDTLSNAARKGVVKMAFTEDLALMAKKYMPAAEKYIHAMGVKMRAGRQYDERLTQVLNQFRGLDSKLQGVGGDTVNGMIQAIDEAKAWPYDPAHLAHLTGVPRADADLTARFNAMEKANPAAAQIVKDVFQTNHEMLSAVRDIVKEVSGDKGLSEFKTLLGIDESQPYNSRRRQGDYVAFAKSKELKDAEANGDHAKVDALRQDEDHYFFQMYDTFHEAQEAVRQLRDTNQYHEVPDAIEADKASDQIVGARNMMLAFQQLQHYIRDQVPAGAINQQVLNGVTKLVNDLYIRSLRQSSSRKSEIRRLGVAGGDMDMMRNFVTQARAQAHFIASMQHSNDIFDTMSQMREQSKNSTLASSIYNEMMARHVSGMTYRPSTLVNRLKGLTGSYMIVTSPAFFLEQGLQPLMLSAPWIGGRHGWMNAVSEMGSAYKHIWKVWGNPTEQFDLTKIADAYKDKKLGAAMQLAAQDLTKRGIIDVGLNQELGTFHSLDDHGQNPIDKVMGKFSEATRKVESFNRITSGLAAYKLERQKLTAKGKLTDKEIHEKAVDYAYDVVYNTHGAYDGFNAPQWMRGPVGSLLTQFRKFQLMQATLLAKMVHGSIQGEDPVHQALMRRAAAYTVAHAAVMGGMMGLPAMGTATWIINNLFSTANDPFDLEDEVRKMAGDDSTANILLHGIPTFGKYGLDLSERVGMGGALSLFPFAKDEPGTTERKSYESLLTAAAGPALGSIPFQVADSLDLMHKWQYYKALEKLMPKGFSNIAKAIREANQGVTNAKGDTLMKPEDVSFFQSFWTGLGLKTSAISERQEKSGLQSEKEQFYKDRTQRIVLEFTQARQEGDSAGMQDARERFRALQDAKWKEGFPRSPLSTLMGAAQSQMLRQRATVEGVQYRQRSPGLRQAREEAED